MLSCAEGGVRGGITSGLLREEAATAEARDQLLAACTSLYLPISPCISLYLPTSPCISPYLRRSPYIRRATSC